MKKYTIIFLALALTAVFAVTAVANEWNLYGNARMATFYTSRDYGKIFQSEDNPSGDDQFGRSNFKSTQWALQGNSRIGATIKGDMIDARFEYGTGVNLRRLYGVWKFTEGWGLKIGQDYTPITFFLSGQAFDGDWGLLQVGNAYGSRKGQIALEGQAGPGMLKVAAITQTTPTVAASVVDPATGVVTALSSSGESYWPKFEASYQMNFADGMSGHVFGGFQNQKFYFNNPIDDTDTSDTINSYVLGIGGDLNFGPMFIKPQFSYYRNGAAAGWLGSVASALGNFSGLPAPVIGQLDDIDTVAIIDGSINNIDTMMAMAAIGFSPTEQLTLEAGIGWTYTDFDDSPGSFDKHTYFEYYLQAVYQMAPGVFLVPEVGYRDFGDLKFVRNADGTQDPDLDLGNLFYVGAKWQINF